MNFILLILVFVLLLNRIQFILNSLLGRYEKERKKQLVRIDFIYFEMQVSKNSFFGIYCVYCMVFNQRKVLFGYFLDGACLFDLLSFFFGNKIYIFIFFRRKEFQVGFKVKVDVCGQDFLGLSRFCLVFVSFLWVGCRFEGRKGVLLRRYFRRFVVLV